MANWKGIIAGAMKGLGDAGSELARGYIKDERELNLENEKSRIVESRQTRLNEHQSRLVTQAYQDRSELDWKNKRDRHPEELRMEKDRLEVISGSRLEADERKRTDALNHWRDYRGDYYNQARDKALAGHIPSPGAAFQAEEHQIKR